MKKAQRKIRLKELPVIGMWRTRKDIKSLAGDYQARAEEDAEIAKEWR